VLYSTLNYIRDKVTPNPCYCITFKTFCTLQYFTNGSYKLTIKHVIRQNFCTSFHSIKPCRYKKLPKCSGQQSLPSLDEKKALIMLLYSWFLTLTCLWMSTHVCSHTAPKRNASRKKTTHKTYTRHSTLHTQVTTTCLRSPIRYMHKAQKICHTLDTLVLLRWRCFHVFEMCTSYHSSCWMSPSMKPHSTLAVCCVGTVTTAGESHVTVMS
jgi:hypothetical protein